MTETMQGGGGGRASWRCAALLMPMSALGAAALVACAGRGEGLTTSDAGGLTCKADDAGDSAPTPPATCPPGGQAWALDWSDEFNGTNVDTSKWQFIVGTRASDQNKTYYQAGNAIESDGTLKLYAKNETVGGASFTGAELIATSAYNQRLYGYFEARIRYQLNGPGFWCNFWMRGTTESPPEFDHEVTSNHVNQIWNQFHGADNGQWVPLDYNGQWHTYAYAWLPGQPVQFYVDNQVTHASEMDPNVPMYPRLRAGAYDSASWGGTPDGTTTWPGIAEYDWFRAWRLVPVAH